MSNLAVLHTKQCSCCKDFKSVFDFSVNKATKDKLQSKCKSCDNQYQRSRKDKRKQWNVEYQAKRRMSSDYRLTMLLNASKQRALKKGREHSITIEDLKDVYPEDNKCPVFGFELEWNSAGFRETNPSIDRIDSSKGYTKDNIQIISWKANRVKSSTTVAELEALLAYMKQGD